MEKDTMQFLREFAGLLNETDPLALD